MDSLRMDPVGLSAKQFFRVERCAETNSSIPGASTLSLKAYPMAPPLSRRRNRGFQSSLGIASKGCCAVHGDVGCFVTWTRRIRPRSSEVAT